MPSGLQDSAIQRSPASLAQLIREFGINPKTGAKWRKRASAEDMKTKPKEPRSTVLTGEAAAAVAAFRRHALLPLDDGLYALQPSIPQPTRSALHRCLQRCAIEGPLVRARWRLHLASSGCRGRQAPKADVQALPHRLLSHRHRRGADGRGKLLPFVGIDRTAKVALAQLGATADRKTACACLRHRLEAVPDLVHTVLTHNGIP